GWPEWLLAEDESYIAQALAASYEELLAPDFWLNEACNILWLQVRRNVFTASEAEEGLGLLRAQVEPTPTASLGLHDVALEIALAVDHSPYDTLYAAFAIAFDAEKLIVADRKFAAAMQRHPDPSLASLPMMLRDWGTANGVTAPHT
ncbi:MAG: type II toxin-antitoxin system VapC family toxin, partial [Acetobacteraceae bacterium]|nr:type II toxin-antitoxin system VapC family toxin [Acetobacteraceae bacterium]